MRWHTRVGWPPPWWPGSGLPAFSNVVDFVPRGRRGFFETAFWIRDHQPQSLDWSTVRRIRQRWRKPLVLKGLLHEDDVRRALDAGVDGIVLGTHGGRQLDWCVSGLDMLPRAREIVQGGMAVYVTGGVRRGTDLLKALALGADAVFAGRAPLYGLCAAGRGGAARALEMLGQEAHDALGLLGARSVRELGPHLLAHASCCAAVGDEHPGHPDRRRRSWSRERAFATSCACSSASPKRPARRPGSPCRNTCCCCRLRAGPSATGRWSASWPSPSCCATTPRSS